MIHALINGIRNPWEKSGSSIQSWTRPVRTGQAMAMSATSARNAPIAWRFRKTETESEGTDSTAGSIVCTGTFIPVIFRSFILSDSQKKGRECTPGRTGWPEDLARIRGYSGDRGDGTTGKMDGVRLGG